MQPGKISFVVQSLDIKTGSNEYLKPLRDKDGFYTMPGFVFYQASRNGKEYDAISMVDCITNPQSRFNRMLVEGCLGGEYGHPFTSDFKRLIKIVEQNQAIFIQKVFTGVLRDGSEVVWVRFKPAGPFGKYFEEALEDPSRNACLSLRAACAEGPTTNGVLKLFPKYLVTFDAVGGGGYQQACKRAAIENQGEILGMEDYSISVEESEITEDVGKQLVHTESYNHQSLLDYFRAESIVVNKQIIRVPANTNLEQAARSFHSLYGKY